MARIILRPTGNLGNHMLQYMFALNLQRLATKPVELFGQKLDVWGISRAIPDDASVKLAKIRDYNLDVRFIAKLISSGLIRDAELRGMGMRIGNYASREIYADVFRADQLTVSGFGPQNIVINVRGAEILGSAHPDYGPMPLSYIDGVIAHTGLKPVFLGQLGDDFYSTRLKEKYSHAEFHPSKGPLADFEMLRRSTHVAVSVSTFSWLAGWLSDATSVHLPVSGIFNPLQRPDIDLLPGDDSRYVFYDFPIRKWDASPKLVEDLWADRVHAILPKSEIDKRKTDSEKKVRLAMLQRKIEIALRVGGEPLLGWLR
jgi:hypothetical protein